MTKSTIKNTPNPTSSGSGEGKHDLIDRQAAIEPESCEDAVSRLPAAQPATNCSEIPNGSDDTISRRMAIDALDKRFDNVPMEQTAEILKLRKDLRELPPAQPEIIRCKDCRFNTYSKKCLNPDSFFLVPADDFYCGYAERRTE